MNNHQSKIRLCLASREKYQQLQIVKKILSTKFHKMLFHFRIFRPKIRSKYIRSQSKLLTGKSKIRHSNKKKLLHNKKDNHCEQKALKQSKQVQIKFSIACIIR